MDELLVAAADAKNRNREPQTGQLKPLIACFDLGLLIQAVVVQTEELLLRHVLL